MQHISSEALVTKGGKQKYVSSKAYFLTRIFTFSFVFMFVFFVVDFYKTHISSNFIFTVW